MARSPSSPSSFRAPRSGFPRFQWLTDLSTAPRIKCAPSPDRGIDNSALSAQMDLTLFVYTLAEARHEFLRRACAPQQVGLLVLETLPPAERLRKRGFAIERVDATEDLPVVDLLVFLMVDSMPSARQVCQCECINARGRLFFRARECAILSAKIPPFRFLH